MKLVLIILIILSTVGGCNSCSTNDWTEEDGQKYQEFKDSIQSRYIGYWCGVSNGHIKIEGKLIERYENSVLYHYDFRDDDYTDYERTLLDSIILDSVYVIISDSTIEINGISQLKQQTFLYDNSYFSSSFLHLENITHQNKSNNIACKINYWIERNDSLEMEIGLDLYEDRIYKFTYKLNLEKTDKKATFDKIFK